MEPLMIRAVDAARKLRRPVREDYIPPVEKVQNLFEAYSFFLLQKKKLLKLYQIGHTKVW